jgi:hypothetical protein
MAAQQFGAGMLVLSGVAVGHGFEPESFQELFSAKKYLKIIVYCFVFGIHELYQRDHYSG